MIIRGMGTTESDIINTFTEALVDGKNQKWLGQIFLIVTSQLLIDKLLFSGKYYKNKDINKNKRTQLRFHKESQ